MESSQEQLNNLCVSKADVEHIGMEMKSRTPNKKHIS